MGIKPLDRQCEERFAAARDHHRSAGPEFGQPAPHSNLITGAKQRGNWVAPTVTHS
jgi:hypothetical protein